MAEDVAFTEVLSTVADPAVALFKSKISVKSWWDDGVNQWSVGLTKITSNQ